MKSKAKDGKSADMAGQSTNHPSNVFRRLAGALPTVTACILLTLGGTTASAESASKEAPLELRKIMQELGRQMQAATDAISQEDWARVASIAPRIAEHPQPPAGEKVRILSFVGTNIARFKAFDGKTHAAAEKMMEAAEHKNGDGVITAFAEIQRGCLGCHQAFRQPFVAHFYKKTATD